MVLFNIVYTVRLLLLDKTVDGINDRVVNNIQVYYQLLFSLWFDLNVVFKLIQRT